MQSLTSFHVATGNLKDEGEIKEKRMYKKRTLLSLLLLSASVSVFAANMESKNVIINKIASRAGLTIKSASGKPILSPG